MSQVALIALAAFLVYLALRVARMRRRSLPFLLAYPLFVLIFVGGSLATFVAAGYGVAQLGFPEEDPRLLIGVYGATLLGAAVLWLIARRAIG